MSASAGATQHLARDCPRKETAKKAAGESSPTGPKPRIHKLLDKNGGNATSQSESGASISPQAASSQSAASEVASETATKAGDPLKNLLDEVHKLLKGMNLEEKGLDRACNRPWCNIEKAESSMGEGWTGHSSSQDRSGTTRSRRPTGHQSDPCLEAKTSRGRPSALPSSESDLGVGEAQDIRMTEGETLVHNSENVEPIVPAGRLVPDLGCRIEWVGENCTLEHPVKGNIELRVEAGCPQIVGSAPRQVPPLSRGP